MNRIWTIVRREYLERVRQRSFILGTVLVPVFMLGVTFLPIWIASRTGGQPVHLAVVDWTASLKGKLEPSFSDSLADGSPRFRFDYQTIPPGADPKTLLEGLQKDVRAGDYTGLLWIPADALTGGTVEMYAMNAADPEIGARVGNAVSRAAMTTRLVQHGVPAAETEAISKNVPLKIFKLTKEGVREGGFESDFVGMLLFAMILYMTILLYGVQVSRSILEEKNSRIVEILLKSARPFQLMLGKIIGIGAVGVTQYAIWGLAATAGGAFIRGMSPAFAQATSIPPSMFVFFVVYFLLGYFLYAAIFAAVGAMATSEQEAQQLQWPVTILIIIPIILLTMVMRNPDGPVVTVLSLIPFFSSVMMMMRINLHMPPAWQIGASMVILVASILGMAALSARIFRVGILMYGKRPTLPELMRWIREA